MFDPTTIQDPAPTLGSPTPCAWCGKMFRLQRRAQKFCSSRCQKVGRRSELGAAGARKSRSPDPDTGVGGFSPINVNKINSLQGQKPPPSIAEYRCCQTCGRAFESAETKTPNCPRCDAYVPLPPRKVDGDWFVIAGPVDYCCGCGLAISPRKPHGFLTPFRGADGDLYCTAHCASSAPSWCGHERRRHPLALPAAQRPGRITGCWEADIVLPAKLAGDIDNRVKGILDVLVKHGVVDDDRHLTRLSVARTGVAATVTVTLRPAT